VSNHHVGLYGAAEPPVRSALQVFVIMMIMMFNKMRNTKAVSCRRIVTVAY